MDIGTRKAKRGAKEQSNDVLTGLDNMELNLKLMLENKRIKFTQYLESATYVDFLFVSKNKKVPRTSNIS